MFPNVRFYFWDLKEIKMNTLIFRRVALACSLAAAFMLSAGAAIAQQALDANAKFCDDFLTTVIRGGKIDEASKYLADDFIEHNVNLTANSRAEFLPKLKAFQDRGGFARAGAAGAAQPQRTVVSHDDVVIFISPRPPQDNPNNPGQKMIPTHFDVFRLRNGKIAEHWD
jgi:predicted SnoaL-like aldol condensation-catalyzing enzyme